MLSSSFSSLFKAPDAFPSKFFQFPFHSAFQNLLQTLELYPTNRLLLGRISLELIHQTLKATPHRLEIYFKGGLTNFNCFLRFVQDNGLKLRLMVANGCVLKRRETRQFQTVATHVFFNLCLKQGATSQLLD